MKNKLFMLGTITLLSLSIFGCGSKETTDAKDNEVISESKETDKKTDRKSDSKSDEPLTVSEILYGNDASIWYECNAIDKNAIPYVYVLYGNGTYIKVKNTEKSLGELTKMTDEEIIDWAMECREIEWELAKEFYWSDMTALKNMQAAINDRTLVATVLNEMGWDTSYDEIIDGIGTANGFIYKDLETYGSKEEASVIFEHSLETFTEHAKAGYMEFPEDETPQYTELLNRLYDKKKQEVMECMPENSELQYGLSLYTDATGNNVQKEVIFLEADDKTFGYRVELSTQQSIEAQEIYETLYSGFRTTENIYFLLKIEDKDTVYELDSIGTENILVDEQVVFQ